MVKTRGAAFNPLVVHSSVGLGKTHLLEGIGYSLKHTHPALQIIQLTAEVFTNSFLDSMRAGSLDAFRIRLRNAGALSSTMSTFWRRSEPP